MSFLGTSSQYMNQSYSPSFGGSYGSSYNGGFSNSLYGSSLINNSSMQQQMPVDPNQANPQLIQQQQQYQFDLRRDIQSTIGGLNASLGLAYGVTQMLNLSRIGIKYLLKALKFVFGKVFNLNNIIAPIKFLVKLLLGTNSKESKSVDYLEQIWKSSNNLPDGPDPNKGFFPKKIFGMSANVFKSLVLALVGLSIQLTLFFLKRGKSKKLEELEKKEHEERERLLEEQWKLAQQEIEPELVLLKDLSEDGDFKEVQIGESQLNVQVYDGDLNPMTFGHVKSSKAFDTHQKVLVEDADSTQCDSFSLGNNSRTNDNLFDYSHHIIKKSEDGWNRRTQA